ncbi:acylneuraminate cytidylyltransferase family protein [Capnocytophaga felis]|uniref:Acylneuraminate cytidylyltransferase n=1 Tax=Capnocytophaga felis TaxID=2267611 RepID=A0A5M4B6R3_9FLAO|nr:acylneuraminate cytidylyltransferase family protein [Capnocytophaga felis]GET45279.1 acylneuraminate cytidylyltransferase [Capnocytophaga felis]GET47558.1 acylneuraminate cytidylyltransferase [Capnocytophaga felis]
MYNGKRILAIIPARGGSKGLPGKNIKPLCGKPLIGWSIEQAQASKYVDEIFVSTDSREIADVAESFGVLIPFLRPKELASDTSPSSEFIIHTIEYYQKKNNNFDYILLVEPTSPLRDTQDIDKCIEMLLNHSYAKSIVGISKIEACHPAFLVKISEEGLLKSYVNQMKTLRRQDIDDLYFFEGSLYLSSIEYYMQEKTFYHELTLPYLMPKYKSFEVDDLLDFQIIERIMELKIKNKIN